MKTSMGKKSIIAIAGLLVVGWLCPVAHAADTSALPNVNLELTDVDARMAIKMLFDSVGRNYAIDQDVQGTIPSLSFKDVPFDTALKNLVRSSGLVYRLDGDIYVISKKVAAQQQAPITTAPDVAVVDTTTTEESTIEKVPLSYTGASEILSMMGQGGSTGSYGTMGGWGNSSFGNSSFGGSSFGNSSFGGNSFGNFGGSSYGGSNRSYGSSGGYNRGSW